MYPVKCIVLSLFFLFILPSCIRDTYMDSGEKPQVFIECILSNTPVQTLRLGFTKGASREYEPATEAEVRLYDVSESIVTGMFMPSDYGVLTLDYEPIPGHTYRIEVCVPGYETITAEQTMPEIKVKAVLYNGFQHYGESYEYNSDPLIVYELASLPEYTWIYAMSWDNSIGKRRITDNLCTDFPFVDNFNLTGEVYDPPVDTVMRWGYEFHYALYWPLKGANMHRKYLRIPHPEQVDKYWLIISGDMEGSFPYTYSSSPLRLIDDGIVDNPEDGQGYIVFTAVSKDYDTYLMDAMRIQSIQESNDMSSLYIRENIFSNIKGGLGLFGAKSEQKLTWMNEKQPIFDESDKVPL